jgi:RNAse (barnase) inhibitor barstar
MDSQTRWISLSLRGVRDKNDLMRTFATAFALSDTFGANWDALADVLQDTACAGATGCAVHVTDSGMALLPEADRATLMAVLSATAAYWSTHGKPFVVLVDGATELPLWT